MRSFMMISMTLEVGFDVLTVFLPNKMVVHDGSYDTEVVYELISYLYVFLIKSKIDAALYVDCVHAHCVVVV